MRLRVIDRIFGGVKLTHCLTALLGSAILAFGMYNVHAQSGITEGGTLGLTLFFDHWFGISPSVTSAVMNVLCYLLGIKMLGRLFIVYSAVSTAGFSAVYALCELFDPLWPELADMPLTASILGAVFVGIGVGLCVRVGGAPSGDDALAMSLSKLTKLNIKWIYLITDLTVLALSATYIPISHLIFSLITVVLSGQIIGAVSASKKEEREVNNDIQKDKRQ